MLPSRLFGFDAIAAGNGPFALVGAEQFFSTDRSYAIPSFPQGGTP